MNKLILSCKKATYLISLKEEGKLSLTQQVQLRAHMTVCSMCKLFEKQTAFISQNARHLHEYRNSSLTAPAKEKISKIIQGLISGE